MEQTPLGQGTSQNRVNNLDLPSVSPWANEATMAEQLGSEYIFSRKLHPAKLEVTDMDEESVGSELCRTPEVASANNCVTELLMKDNNALGNNPMNVINLCRIAREETDRL